VAFNRLITQYISDDKMIKGYVQWRAGGHRAQGATADSYAFEYMYIDWHINPNLYFRLGRQDQTFMPYAPSELMGHADGHVVGVGFGNAHVTARDAIRAYIKFNDNVRMEIQLNDPNTEADANDELNLVRSGNLAGNALESNNIPRFDISLPITIANFSFEPGFTYLKQNWDQVRAGDDDSFAIWGVGLDVKAAFGPLTLTGEISYVENYGAGNYVGNANNVPMVYADASGVNKIADGEALLWFIQGEFNFGPAAVQLIYGMDRSKNDGRPDVSRDAAEYDITQIMYALRVPIFVTKNFTITPQIFFYDYDDSAVIGATSATWDIDRGKEFMAGVQFTLVF